MGRKTRHTAEQVKAAMEEISKQTDRGAGIIAAAILDEMLETIIQARLLELNRDHYDALFGPEKPLGSFSAKIEIGFALGFYSEQGYKVLHAARAVRNKFAHRIEALEFDHPDVAAIVEKSFGDEFGATRRDRFLTAIRAMAMLLLAPHAADVRIKSLYDTNPNIYLEVFRAIDPNLGSIVEKALQEKPGQDSANLLESGPD
jgi:hypothetical protein